MVGGRHGALAIGAYIDEQRTFRVNVSGNRFELDTPTDHLDDYRGSIASLAVCDSAYVCGNTLVSGNQGVWLYTSTTNVFIFKNDFGAVNHRSISYDGPAGELQSAAVFNNILSQGDSYHLKLPYNDSVKWFLGRNRYRAGSNNTVPLVIDALGSPIHLSN